MKNNANLMNNRRKIQLFLFFIISLLHLRAATGLPAAGDKLAFENIAAYNYTFRQITVLDGMPDDAVKTLFTLPDGRLGIRSSYGLSLYDGCDFRNFPVLPSERVYQLDYISANPHVYVDMNGLVWTKETNALSVFDLKQENYIENVDSLLKSLGVHGHIRNFFLDHDRNLWWIDSNNRLWYKDLGAERPPKRYPFPGKGLRDITVFNRKMWLVYENGLVICADRANGNVFSRERLWNVNVPPRYPVAFRENGRLLWVLWDKGVACCAQDYNSWPLPAGRWLSMPVNVASRTSTICLEPGTDGWAWAGIEQNGLYLINGSERRVIRRVPLVSTNGDDFENDVQSILYNPANGNLWLGLYTRGLAYYNASMEMLPFLDFRKEHIMFDNNLHITEVANGNLLLITSPQPLMYAPSTGKVTPVYPELRNQRCISAYYDSKGRIWIGTFRKGFYEINGGNIRLHNITKTEGDVAFNLVRGFIEDNKGRLYVNFHGGLGIYNEHTGLIEPLYRRHPMLKNYTVINRMAKDKDGCLWIAARQGVYKYDPARDKVFLAQNLAHNEDDRKILSADSKAIFCDSRGLIWFGTNTGLHVWNPESSHFEDIPRIPNDVIQAVVEDASHNIWVATANGLCRIDISSGRGGYNYSTQFFEKNFRLKDSEFLFNSAFADTKGNVYLGCTSGLYTIPSSKVRSQVYTGHPLITSFYLYDKEVIPGREYGRRIILKNAMPYTKSIRLKSDENFFTLHFTGLNFANPEHTCYRYRLEGVDKGWIEASPKGGKGVATYTNLSPGTYTFQVYSAGVDKHWSKEAAAVEIIIDAPLWATWWAKVFYVLLVFSGIMYYFRYREIRNKECMERQKQKELDNMKYRFFTNISHEFRTLLTLIITPLGTVLKKMDKGPLQDELKMVSHNAGELLQLVNQLLDFRKLEMNGELLHLLNGPVGEFVEIVVTKFKPLADQKKINLTFSDESRQLYMFFDRDKLRKIMDNLLSNALKFTPDDGTVSVKLWRTQSIDNQSVIKIEVNDTGCGMSEESLKHIFDRFYRVEKEEGRSVGSGIGLNLVQEYVKLHKGTLCVASQLGKGSSFTLALPIDLKPDEVSDAQDTFKETIKDDTNPHMSEEEIAKKDNTILIVEDNEDFRHFLAHELGAVYHVFTASDGIEGALTAEEKNPDLIISDIMMPRMNGIDLCKRIKSCLPTSHIPVILLTAKSSDQSRAEGYDVGADAYISKPFDMDVLLARIRNLLRHQSERRHEFSHNITLDPSQVSITSKDEEFMRQAIDCIENHISDPEYMTDNLASDVAMSRMSLYRKLKAVTGQTPADFIRTVRLKYAAGLLKKGGMTVAEVCEKTGFVTSQNFTRRFREMFGVLPSHYK